MKATGIVRRVDELGRIVIPMELRRTMQIAIYDEIETYVNGDQIVLKKYQPPCVFCDNVDKLIVFSGKRICNECLEKLVKE